MEKVTITLITKNGYGFDVQLSEKSAEELKAVLEAGDSIVGVE